VDFGLVKNNVIPEDININNIFNKIAPYLSNPDNILQFLKKHSSVPKEDLIEIIENEIKNSEPIKRTDLRILLNSI
jgi:hypothetical protein